MAKNKVNIVKCDNELKTLIIVNGIIIEKRHYDFEPNKVLVCLKCGNEHESETTCSCDGESITFKEYCASAEF